VRDALLARPIGDIDIATDAPPERVAEIAAAAGLRAVPTGLAHGTITVIAEGRAHEVTTLRRDVETFGRHARVAFDASLAEDAARRDFTINALYATPEGEVIDPTGQGLADLGAGRVRFVGDPARRIAEDGLRILRFFRFTAYYADPAGGIDADGLAACAAAVPEALAPVSAERIGAEMRRLLAAPDPAPAVAAMAAAGVLSAVLPGAAATHLAPLVHAEGGRPAGWIARLAALGGEDAARRLRLSRAEARDLAALGAAARSEATPAALGHLAGAEAARAAVLLRAALMLSAPDPGAEAAILRGARARFPIRAADLMPALGGPALGARLGRLRARWIASDFTLTRAELLEGPDDDA
jgi:poly(A) polymerase